MSIGNSGSVGRGKPFTAHKKIKHEGLILPNSHQKIVSASAQEEDIDFPHWRTHKMRVSFKAVSID